MIGTLAFSLVMIVFSWLSIWWLKGGLSAYVEKQRTKALVSKGRKVSFSIWKWQIAFTVDRNFWIRVAFLVLGPSAVIGLSVAYAQLLPLRVVFAIYVLPAYIIMLVLGLMYPEWGKKAAIGFTAGVLATIIYDVARLALALARPYTAYWYPMAGC